jgi:hypothetical protein
MLGSGEWIVEVSNNNSTIRAVPVGLTSEGDGWPLANSGWLGFRSLGISINDVSGTPDHRAPKIAFRLIGNSPNPFNPQTTIAYDLPKQTAVSLRVFDLSGRLVRVLVDGEIIAEGRNEAIWNGRDDTGKRVASGTYFYRLEAGEYSETRRMALIK